MKNLQELLKQLARKVEDEIQCRIKASSTNEHEYIYCRKKIANFQQNTENKNLQIQTEYINKKNYSLSQEVINNIKNSEEYQAILEYQLSKNNVEITVLDDFINFISNAFLNESNINEFKINSIVDTFLKDINKEALKCNVNIELSGLEVKTAPIEINFDKLKIILREVEGKDLEKEYIIYPYLYIPPIHNISYYTISAIANVESYLDEEHVNEIEFEVQKTIAILRLFQVCSVNYLSYKLETEAIVSTRKINDTAINFKYFGYNNISLQVTENNKISFIQFFKELANIIPKTFYNLDSEKKKWFI